MAEWPEFPDVNVLEDCPDNAVCITDVDHVRIVFWVDQVSRIYESFSVCEGVEFKDLPDPNQDHVSP